MYNIDVYIILNEYKFSLFALNICYVTPLNIVVNACNLFIASLCLSLISDENDVPYFFLVIKYVTNK